MIHPFSRLLLGAALCGGLNAAALAQTSTAPVPSTAPAAETRSAHTISIKNVPPSLIAYWLDPKNNSLPRELQSRDTSPLAATKNAYNASVFALPSGIDRIVAIDPQKALLVFGTDAGFGKLAETVAFLDRPLRQVEVEAQWVQVSAEDARAFGITYNASQGNFNAAANGFAAAPSPQSPQIGFVRGNHAATLARLVKENRAKILTAPRVTVINNLHAEMGSFASSPAEVRLGNDANQFASLFAGATQVGIEYMFGVTPTINNDDTVTVLISTSSALKMTTAAGDELVSRRPQQAVETIVNVRDGETVALGGNLLRRVAPANGAAQPQSNLIVFITPRIVRRAGDDAVKPVSLPR